MNNILRNVITTNTIPFNKDVAGGLAVHYVDKLPEWLTVVIKASFKQLIPIGVVFNGFRLLTPREAYTDNINAAYNKNVVDVSRNNLYKLEFKFTFNGVELSRIIALPYVGPGGLLKLSSSNYAIVGVFSEYPISTAPGVILVRLLRDKLLIKKMGRNVLVNGVVKSLPIHHTKAYKLIENVNKTIPIALYVFLKYGFYGTFEKFFKTKPKVFVDRKLNLDKFLDDGYTVFESTGKKPRVLKTLEYKRHYVRILVKTKDITPHLESMMGALIYSFDLEPGYAQGLANRIGIKPDTNVDLTFENIDKETNYWLMLLGKIVFKNAYTLEKILIDMLEHVQVLLSYIDPIVEEKLKDIGLNLNSIYDLYMYVIGEFDNYQSRDKKVLNDISNKYIEIPYYINYVITTAVNRLSLDVVRANNKGKLTERELVRLFNRHLSSRLIYQLVKANKVNIAIKPVDATNDMLYYKITSALESQSNANGITAKKKTELPFNARTISGGDLYLGSILNMSKKMPSPVFKINPWVDVNLKSGRININKPRRKTINMLNEMLDTDGRNLIDDEETSTVDENYE